jgi:hypothetical protein
MANYSDEGAEPLEPIPRPELADRDRHEFDALVREPAFLLFRCRPR